METPDETAASRMSRGFDAGNTPRFAALPHLSAGPASARAALQPTVNKSQKSNTSMQQNSARGSNDSSTATSSSKQHVSFCPTVDSVAAADSTPEAPAAHTTSDIESPFLSEQRSLYAGSTPGLSLQHFAEEHDYQIQQQEQQQQVLLLAMLVLRCHLLPMHACSTDAALLSRSACPAVVCCDIPKPSGVLQAGSQSGLSGSTNSRRSSVRFSNADHIMAAPPASTNTASVPKSDMHQDHEGSRADDDIESQPTPAESARLSLHAGCTPLPSRSATPEPSEGTTATGATAGLQAHGANSAAADDDIETGAEQKPMAGRAASTAPRAPQAPPLHNDATSAHVGSIAAAAQPVTCAHAARTPADWRSHGGNSVRGMVCALEFDFDGGALRRGLGGTSKLHTQESVGGNVAAAQHVGNDGAAATPKVWAAFLPACFRDAG